MTRSLKIKLRFVAGVVVLGLVFLGIALLPGNFEGVYRSESFGGGGGFSDNYWEAKEGKIVSHAVEEDGALYEPSFLFMDYETEASGAIAIRFRSSKEGEAEAIFWRAHPHFLVTEFVSVDDHKSTWIWKVPTCFGLREKFAAAHTREFVVVRRTPKIGPGAKL